MATLNDERRLLPTRKAAEVLGVHPDTLVRLAAEGRIPAVRLRPRGWLKFRPGDLARFVGEVPTAAEREARIAELEARLAAEQRALALERLAACADQGEAA